jgi:hypothetical protein
VNTAAEQEPDGPLFGPTLTAADGRRQRRELQDVARAGAEAADLVVRAQLEAGMDRDRIEISAEKVLGDRFVNPTAVSNAFYGAYDETVRTYVAEARGLEMEAG